MRFFSRLFGASKNSDQNSNKQASDAAQTLHTSITRALAGVVYYDSTMGEFERSFSRIGGIKEPGYRANDIVAALIQALLKNGTVTGKETLSDIVEAKIQRLHESNLPLRDLQPCVSHFLDLATKDARNLKADKAILGLLAFANDAFRELAVNNNTENTFDQAAVKRVLDRLAKYKTIAHFIDTGENETAASTSSLAFDKETKRLQTVIDSLEDDNSNISRISEIIPTSISNSGQRLAAEAFSACIKREDRLSISSLLDCIGKDSPVWQYDTNATRSIAKQLLLSGLSPNTKLNNEPLIYAAIGGNGSSEYYTELLIRHGADLNAENRDGYSPLGAHLRKQGAGLYRFEPYIKYGARLNIKDLSDFKVYGAIFQGGLYDIAKTIPEDKLKPLVKKGAGKTEVTLLHLAAGGPQINASPELQAMFKTRYLENDGYPSVIELLLDCGADPLQRTSTGYSAANIALKYGHHQVFLILSRRFRDNPSCFSRIIDEPFRGKGTALFNACLRGDTGEVKFLLELGANPNARSFVNYPENNLFEPDVPQEVGARLFQDSISSHINPNFFHHMEYGVTNLHYPATNNDSEIVHMLLEAGADPNAICYNGLFPLYVAAETGNLDVIKELISYGAEVNKTTPKGCTPILNAAEEGELETVQYLLDNGADPYIRNRAGQTAIDAAIAMGQTQAVQIMKSNR